MNYEALWFFFLQVRLEFDMALVFETGTWDSCLLCHTRAENLHRKKSGLSLLISRNLLPTSGPSSKGSITSSAATTLNHIKPTKQNTARATRPVQWVKVLIGKSDDLSSIPETHMIEEENDSNRLPSDLHTISIECVCPFQINKFI